MDYSNLTMYTFYENLKKLFEVNNRTTINLKYRELSNQNKKTSTSATAASIYCDTYKMLHINKAGQHYFISCKAAAKQLLDMYAVPHMTSASKTDAFLHKIVYNSSDIINDYAEFWLELYDNIYLNGPESYSCCSRYTDCSNALHCVNPLATDGLLCKYKKNLEKGYVFYGENSVILPDKSFDMNKVQKNLEQLPKNNIQKIALEVKTIK